MKTAVVLLNFGTPSAPTRLAVGRYLQQMLTDGRVLDLAWPVRMALGGLLIPALRSGRSAAAYRRIWRQEGSPLMVHTRQLAEALRSRLNRQAGSGGDRRDEYRIWPAMRLGSPSIEQALDEAQGWRPQRLILLPLYPQYASSTTGSALERAFAHLKRWRLMPEIRTIRQYADAPGMIAAFAAPALTEPGLSRLRQSDAVLFSFHGLPTRQLGSACGSGAAPDCACQGKTAGGGGQSADLYCYRAACWATARALAAALALPTDKWQLGFQSRLRGEWLRPYTDSLVGRMAEQGVKKLVVFCPSFTTDCLETLEEVGLGLAADFRARGGEKLTLMPCPNASPAWVDFLSSLAAGQGGQAGQGEQSDQGA